MAAICKYACKNGGKCVKPDVCHCKVGFSGNHCELDRNECQQDKPCDQNCYNTLGSYYCSCRDGFVLQADKQSCKKLANAYGLAGRSDDAFEARDLENDVEYSDLNSKINNIEKVRFLL